MSDRLEEILGNCPPLLIGKYRGEPILKPEVETLKQALQSYIDTKIVEARIETAKYIVNEGVWTSDSKAMYCFACNTYTHKDSYPKNTIANYCTECGKEIVLYPIPAAMRFIMNYATELEKALNHRKEKYEN